MDFTSWTKYACLIDPCNFLHHILLFWFLQSTFLAVLLLSPDKHGSFLLHRGLTSSLTNYFITCLSQSFNHLFWFVSLYFFFLKKHINTLILILFLKSVPVYHSHWEHKIWNISIRLNFWFSIYLNFVVCFLTVAGQMRIAKCNTNYNTWMPKGSVNPSSPKNSVC